MCRDRILGRLGIKEDMPARPRKYGQKAFIGSSLDKLISEFSRQIKTNNKKRTDLSPKTHLQDYRLCTERLLACLSELNAKRSRNPKVLTAMIGCVADFLKKVPLGAVLDSIEDRYMDSHQKKRLLGCLAKTARMQESAKFLCKAARKTPVLRAVIVEQVYLPKDCLKIPSSEEVVESIDSVLARLSRLDETVIRRKDLPKWTQKRLAENPEDHFETHVNKTHRSSKIHAEIQILAHYEQRNNQDPDPEPDVVVVPPRVIASCKKPCYLCHTAISLHGRYWAPPSHGKLYSSWRIPVMAELGPLRRELVKVLEQKMIATIWELGRKAEEKPKDSFLNESSIYTLSMSSSTVTRLSTLSSLDLISGVHVAGSSQHLDLPGPSGQTTVSVTATSAADDAVPQTPSVNNESQSHDEEISLTQTKAESGMASDLGAVSGKQPIEEGRIPKEPSTKTHNEADIKHDAASTPSKDGKGHPFQTMPGLNDWFRSRDLDIFIDSTSGGRLQYAPRWLESTDEAAAILGDNTRKLWMSGLIDVLALATGEDVSFPRVGHDGNVYFSFGGRVIVIQPRGI